MKLHALALLAVGNLIATPSFAGDVSQPLTRAACETAGTTWEENANVCSEKEAGSETSPATTILGQPLRRADCNKAGMTWKENANVCSSDSGGAKVAVTPDTKSEGRKPGSNVLISIDKTSQKMTVFMDGVEKYHWPVSTGRTGYSTPTGTFKPTSMNEVWYSQEWDNAPMPHAIFSMKDGHAIHGSYEVKALGKPVSHGCVRISPQNATTLYALVGKNGMENTQVVLTGLTPGGESKVATSGNHQSRDGRGAGRSFTATDNSYAQPQRRRGFFGRLFGAR